MKKLHDLHRFTSHKWFQVMDLCSEQQVKLIDACLNKFWVELGEFGLGFEEEKKRERREERERRRESERTGSDLF